jgi:hypothetical protein
MRVGFDLDGVLADLHHTFASVALKLYPGLDASIVESEVIGASPSDAAAPDPEQVPESEPPDTASGLGRTNLALSRRQNRAIWDELCRTEDFWETLRETEPGIIKRVAAAAEELRWEVIFLTSRPTSAGRTVQRQSQRWLERCGFSLPSVFVVHGSRGKIAEALALDVVIDDRPENCLDVVLESKARAVLIWRGPKATVPASARRLGIGVEPTVHACLDVLIEAERAAATPADFMQRLRRLLGIQIKPAKSSDRLREL